MAEYYDSETLYDSPQLERLNEVLDNMTEELPVNHSGTSFSSPGNRTHSHRDIKHRGERREACAKQAIAVLCFIVYILLHFSQNDSIQEIADV